MLGFISWVVRWQFVLLMVKLATLCQNQIKNLPMGNCIWFEIICNLNSYFWRVSFRRICNHPLSFLGSTHLTFKTLHFTYLFIFIIRILKILQETVCFYTHVSCVFGWFRNRELNLHEIIIFLQMSPWNWYFPMKISMKLPKLLHLCLWISCLEKQNRLSQSFYTPVPGLANCSWIY